MIKNIDNFIILDQKRIIVLGGEKAREILYFNNTDEIGQSSLNRKNVILLISARQIYYKGLIFSRKARSKLGELVRTKFLNLLPVPENELYYSYFVDEDKTDIRVLCFAVNKSLLDEKYEMISRLGAKIKAVYPVPLLYFLKYRREEIFKEKRESHFNNEDEGFIYLNELADMLYFTVFYKGGIYLHSCNIADYADEIVEIEEYFNEHLNISKLISCKNEKSSPLDLLNAIDKKALKQVNILKSMDLEKEKQLNKYKKIIAAMFFLLVLGNFLSLYSYFQYKSEVLEIKRKEITQLKPALEYLNSLQNELSISSEQLKVYEGIVTDRKTYLPWILEINLRLPRDVKIDKLIFKDDSMVLLEGTAISASKAMELLQESEWFSNLEFIGSITTEKGREKFKLAGDLADE